jgi:hypothetical protein
MTLTNRRILREIWWWINVDNILTVSKHSYRNLINPRNIPAIAKRGTRPLTEDSNQSARRDLRHFFHGRSLNSNMQICKLTVRHVLIFFLFDCLCFMFWLDFICTFQYLIGVDDVVDSSWFTILLHTQCKLKITFLQNLLWIWNFSGVGV